MEAESPIVPLEGIKPVVEEMISITGAVGLSYGILHL